MRWAPVVALVTLAGALHAQTVQPEARFDVLGPRPYSLQPGVGAAIAMGNYVRAGIDVGYALEPRADLVAEHWRGDLLARVTMDPFREQRWGLSLGGGLSVRRHTYLAAVLDLEGPAMRGVIPAMQVGLSGGVRAGVILRRAMKGRR
jgi:hypothetical protein